VSDPAVPAKVLEYFCLRAKCDMCGKGPHSIVERESFNPAVIDLECKACGAKWQATRDFIKLWWETINDRN
jgi:hypothetical protein